MFLMQFDKVLKKLPVFYSHKILNYGIMTAQKNKLLEGLVYSRSGRILGTAVKEYAKICNVV